MEFLYDITVIVPVYNVEDYLRDCLDSLINQTIAQGRMEVVLVNDGSKDKSPEICDEYAAKYDFIKVYHRENGGVSAARNFGIDNAHGKYIMYLDSDDYLSKGSVKSLVSFFDKHYDEVDLVTYNEMRVRDGKVKPSTHFRYNYINKTGVYDLTDPEYMYFAQTHMNICVKNRGKDNFKFDTTMIFHEDQKYILTNLAQKNKIGFCDKATYYYLANAGGATSLRSHPYYIFEKTIALWESFLLNRKAPKYVQVYFLHDFNWKLRADMLWPYQYKNLEFQEQFERVVNLIKCVDDDVILDFKPLVRAHKIYVLGLKYDNQIEVRPEDDVYSFYHNGEKLWDCDSIEIMFSRFKIKDKKLTMIGVVKCLGCNMTDDVVVNAIFTKKDGTVKTEKLQLRYSSLSLLASKTKTNNFKMFVIKCPVDDLKSIEFKALFMNKEYKINFTYVTTCPFNTKLKRESYTCEGIRVKSRSPKFTFSKASLPHFISDTFKTVKVAPKIGYRNAITRFIAPVYKKKNRIWLYCDSSKTVMDNGYYQFLHDVKKNDGVNRYYVYNKDADIKGWFDDSLKDNLVEYGSVRHRLLGLSAEKVITSYYGLRDMLSYPYGAFIYFSDITNFDVVYLQHGVLHANLPTMYSLDRMMIDKEVISTNFELESLQQNYCFDESFLIKSGMPRYNHIDKTKKAEKKILFAPSWRKFIVIPDGKGGWNPNEKAFLNSEFYKKVMDFLNSPKLHEALEENDYVLDFKPHPIFRMYDHLFEFKNERVRIADNTVDEFSYSIFVTDFSSFVFDFVYLKRPVLYFVPDKELFDAGLNHYRRLDLPFEDAFGEFSTTGEKVVDDIVALIKNDCVPDKKYVEKMESLFFDVDDHEEAIYQELMNE